MSKRKPLSMQKTFFLAILTPGVVLVALLIIVSVFSYLFTSTNDQVYFILMLAIGGVLAVLFLVTFILSFRRLRQIYVDGVFRVTKENLEKLGQGDNSFEHYPDLPISEIRELNHWLDDASDRWRVSVLYSREIDFDELGITFVDREHHLVTEDYLLEHLNTLIHASNAFTVGLLSLFYDIGKEALNEEEKERLLQTADRAFAFIPCRIFAFGKDEKSLLCYLPGIDSLRIIKEKITGFCADLSVSKPQPTGMALAGIKSAMVCYPHSSLGDMISDLTYAKRQLAPMTFFLPDRKRIVGKDFTLNEHQDSVAFFNKVLLPVRHLPGKGDDRETEILKRVFEAVAAYIGSDFHDVVILESTTNHYYSYFGDREHQIPSEMIENLISIVDEDNSFYFSSRTSCSDVIARYVDDFGISSGILYALYNGEKCAGVLYYGKREGEMVLDAYMKEALIRLGEAFTDYFFLAEKERRASFFQRETEHILGLSNYMIYKVEDSTLKLTYFSPNLKAYFPRCELGEPCYKAIYGLERMCPHCPMKTFGKKMEEQRVKMSSKVRNVFFETSLTLNDEKSHERSLLVERVQSNESSDPYDKNWLSYSYATLIRQLEDAYLIHSRGYLLLLSLDNLEKFVTSQGSEGACFSIRVFIQEIKKALDTHDVYAYNPSCVALLLPRIGHVEIIDVCEKVYEISKKHYFDDGSGEDSFTLTYLPLGYPRGHTSALDFLSHAEEFYRNGDYKSGRDFIYFHDHSISRSASKKDHMLAVIDEVFATKTANCVVLQPMVTASDKKIFGAEVLLRVEDTQRHNFFRADELSRIAEANGRISIITESLLNFVADLYNEHGNSVFALNSFHRISINVDAAFLKDTELSKKVAALYNDQHLGKDFLAFEVPEDLIGEDFSGEGNAFATSVALLVCDRYTGKYVSMEKLKKYGFREVKLPRELVNGIDVDAKKLSELAAIVEQAKSLEMKVSVVGVENNAQYQALNNLDPTMLMQGYYFYKPLSRADLINAIVKH
ncbi:MAG: EAL domain-containing protein [Bacilli bacterium]|nr:EAL domain-containing protein [Bacilli bacterium]